MLNTNTLALTTPLLNEATGRIVETTTGSDSKKSFLTTQTNYVFVFLFLCGILQLSSVTITILDDQSDSMIEIVIIVASSLANVGMLLLLVAIVFQLQAKDKLREIITALRQQVGVIQIQIDRLTGYASRLGEETKYLGDVEARLMELAQEQKTDADRIVELVKESRDISSDQMKCVMATAKFHVTGVILKAFESSGSKTYLDENGLNHLCLAIECLDYGIDGKIFESYVLETNRSLIAVLKLVNTLVDQNSDNNSGGNSISSSSGGDVGNPNMRASVNMKLDYWKVPSSSDAMDRRRNFSAIPNPSRTKIFSMNHVFEHYCV